MTRRMTNMTFIEAVSALKLLTKPDPDDPYVVEFDMDERPFITRPGVDQRRIALTRGCLYDVRVTDHDGHHSVFSDFFSPRVKDILANDWELWEAK